MTFCFVHIGLVGGLALLGGLLQLRFYGKYATRHETVVLPRNKWFSLQLAAHYALMSLALLNIIVRHALSGHEPLYGYELVQLAAPFAVWGMSLALIMVSDSLAWNLRLRFLSQRYTYEYI